MVILANQRDSLIPPRFNTNTQKLKKAIYIYTNIYKGEAILQIFIEAEGSVRNCIGVLNGPTGSASNAYMVPRQLHRGTEQARWK